MPARLKVLLGAVQTIVLLANSSEIFANTVCLWPGMIKSKCISSDIIRRLFRKQISPTLASSSGVQTRPTGLWGLQNRRTLF